jgi:hypothetical protein
MDVGIEGRCLSETLSAFSKQDFVRSFFSSCLLYVITNSGALNTWLIVMEERLNLCLVTDFLIWESEESSLILFCFVLSHETFASACMHFLDGNGTSISLDRNGRRFPGRSNESALNCIPIFEAEVREPVRDVSAYQIGEQPSSKTQTAN